MKFKNDTNKVIMIALPNKEQPHAPIWKALEPKQEMELDEAIGAKYKLSPVAFKSQVGKKKVETKIFRKKKR